MIRLRTAIYARHSTIMQNSESSSDQAIACLQLVERLGGTLVGTFSDPETSGYRRDRPELLRLLEEIRQGRIDLIVCESIDRIARDGEDIAWLGKKLRYDHVRFYTHVEGEIDEIKLAVAAMLGSMFLSNLQKKTLRGMKAAVLAGRHAGGRAYGYRRVDKLDERGEPVRGVMELVPDQTEVVLRIHRDFAAGMSSIQIATALNRANVPGPRGGQWNSSTIRGDRKKLVGIINNPLYRGLLVWNRREWRKDPDSEHRQRRYRLRDRSEWVVTGIPDLRIIDDALAAAVDAELDSRTRPDRVSDPDGALGPDKARRSKHLLSGLIRCGQCGANYTIASKDYYRCAGQKERGTCGNTVSVRVAPLETAVLTALKDELLTDDLADLFVSEFRRETDRLRRVGRQGDEGAVARLRVVEAELANLAANLTAGAVGPTIIGMIGEREAEKGRIEAQLAATSRKQPAIVVPHRELVEMFRSRVADLQNSLSDPEVRTQGAKILKDLLESVTILPDEDGGPQAEIAASPSKLIAYAQNARTPRRMTDGGETCTVMVVAGTGFEPVTFRL